MWLETSQTKVSTWVYEDVEIKLKIYKDMVPLYVKRSLKNILFNKKSRLKKKKRILRHNIKIVEKCHLL